MTGEVSERDELDSFERALFEARDTQPTLARQLEVQAVVADVMGFTLPAPQLDGYEIDRKVGAGGMGVVFRARARDSDKPVAIKVIARNAQFERARFAREISMLRELAFPGIVRYLDHGTTSDGLPYLVTEWVDGEDLGARLRKGPLAVRDALQVVLAAARALVPVHRAGVIHRDIKPANLMLAGPGYEDVRVIDFGIARSQVSGTLLTATGAVLGTPHYMAPEQIRGVSEARTDVYALGVTLFEALVGRPPFVGENVSAVALAVLAAAPPSLVSLRPEIPTAVDALVGRMLAKNPSDRPIDMAAAVTELGQLEGALARGDAMPRVLSRAERAPRASTVPPPADHGGLLGRERICAQLEGVLAEVLAEQTAMLVSITGEAGSGKSSVLDEVASSTREFRCLHARASRGNAGVPFAMARELLTSASSDADVAVLFDPVGDHIDPLVWGDRIVLAWLDRIQAFLDERPLLILVDNADLADLSSQRLLDRALAQFIEQSLCVIVTQASASTTLGAQLPERAVVRAPLSPIGSRSCRALARRWAGAASEAARERVVQIAAGNPSQLRELCRALARGDAIDARSAADLVWSRLLALDPELRRTLRAASIVGREPWPGAVARLLGLPASDPGLARRLRAAIDEGYLQTSACSRIRGEAQLEFVNELAFLAAYELNEEADLRAGHAVVAAWLSEHAPEADAQIARHLDAAGAVELAARHHLAAARAAFAGGDRALCDEALVRAQAETAPDEVAAEAAAVQALVHFWAGATHDALAAGMSALGRLPAGSRGWFEAAGTAISAAGQRGDNATVRSLADRIMATTPCSSAAAEARSVALFRTIIQLFALGTDPTYVRSLHEAARSVQLSELGPEGRAWWHRADSTLHADSLDASLDAIVLGHRAHVEQGDLRSAALTGIQLCSYYVWSGAWERARETIDEAMRIAQRLSIEYLLLWGTYAEAKLMVETAPYANTRRLLDRVVAGAQASPRIRAGALVYTALSAAKAGEHEDALTAANAARQAHRSPVTELAATACIVRSLIALGRASECAELAEALAPHARTPKRLIEFDELVRLAWAEAMLEAHDGASEIVQQAVEGANTAIALRAATLADPIRRNHYLARPHLVVATVALARRRAAPGG